MEVQAYSPKAFCQAFSISRATFYRLLAAGTIAAKKLGPKRIVVTAAEAKRWLDESAPAR